MNAPSAADFETAARAAVARLPELFQRELSGVVLRVENFASREQLSSLGIDDPYDLTGLYEGVALTERSQWDRVGLPPVITLFRQPMLAEMEKNRCQLCRTGAPCGDPRGRPPLRPVRR
jgi:predicted Zn-dependent protease with MMP-like domain